MNKEIEARFWRRLDNPEVMGYKVADEARQIAEFVENLELVVYDTYSTGCFGRYVEGKLRSYQFNEQEYDELFITTTLDLHAVQIRSLCLAYFLDWLKDTWADRLAFARENNI